MLLSSGSLMTRLKRQLILQSLCFINFASSAFLYAFMAYWSIVIHNSEALVAFTGKYITFRQKAIICSADPSSSSFSGMLNIGFWAKSWLVAIHSCLIRARICLLTGIMVENAQLITKSSLSGWVKLLSENVLIAFFAHGMLLSRIVSDEEIPLMDTRTQDSVHLFLSGKSIFQISQTVGSPFLVFQPALNAASWR